MTNVASNNVQNDVTIIVQSRARTNDDPIRATATWGKESVNIMSDTVETNNQTLFVAVSKGMILHINMSKPFLHFTCTQLIESTDCDFGFCCNHRNGAPAYLYDDNNNKH